MPAWQHRRRYRAVRARRWSAPITATRVDGVTVTGGPHTSHTTNPVRCARRRAGRTPYDGRLDIAPTLLHLLGLTQPAEMTDAGRCDSPT
jgi:bisphosphoglycerate-independent phosphoglycerate mutase (AlkP superfamily)